MRGLPTFTAQCCAGMNRTFRRVTDERELKPGGRGFELLEQVGERDTHDESVLRGHIDMDDEVFGRNWSKHQVQITTSQTE